MNNNSYHEAGMKVLNWRKLSVGMKARYGSWKAISDATWTTKYRVVVTQHNGKTLKAPYIYPFESSEDANTCRQWWLEDNCWAEIEEV